MRFKFVFCRNCLNDSFSWSCLIISSLIFSDRWISFLANDACSFLIIKWRMFVLDLSSDVYDETSDLMKHLIKLDESDSTDLMNENVISSNLTKATHQIWRKRHFIKSLKEKTILLFSDEQSHAVTFDVKNLILQKIIFLYENKCLCEIVVISERFNESWTLIKLSFFLREKLQVMSR